MRKLKSLVLQFMALWYAFLSGGCVPIHRALDVPLPVDRLSAAIQPLQSEGRTFCTAFSINAQAGYWITAAHCALVADQLWKEGGSPVTIDHEYAVIVDIDANWDLAVFEGKHVAGLPLALRPPAIGDQIRVIGYPYGLVRASTYGYMSARNLLLMHPVFERLIPSDLLDVTTAGGNSGSPVINREGEVIGVLWGGFTGSPHALSVPWEALTATLLGYWGA